MSAYFHLPLKKAAKAIGVSETYLKTTCRKLGFQRWPFRAKALVLVNVHACVVTVGASMWPLIP